MQQTEKYKLNLIESSDPFLPEGLNQNTQKIEDAMTAHEEKVDGQVANLDTRLAVFEAKKFAYGRFYPTSNPYFFALPFTPKLVFVHAENFSTSRMAIMGSDVRPLTLKEKGFEVAGDLYTCGFCVYFALG